MVSFVCFSFMYFLVGIVKVVDEEYSNSQVQRIEVDYISMWSIWRCLLTFSVGEVFGEEGQLMYGEMEVGCLIGFCCRNIMREFP